MEELEALTRALVLDGAGVPLPALRPLPQRSPLLEEAEADLAAAAAQPGRAAAAAAWAAGVGAWERAQQGPCPLVLDATGLAAPYARSEGSGAGSAAGAAAAPAAPGPGSSAGGAGGAEVVRSLLAAIAVPEAGAAGGAAQLGGDKGREEGGISPCTEYPTPLLEGKEEREEEES